MLDLNGDDFADLARRENIATQALEVAEAAKGRAYCYGGKTADGFDCSGFVFHVLERAFPEAIVRYSAAVPFVHSSLCTRLGGRADALPGDFIFFTEHDGSNNHIGIVLSDSEWIGSQTSTGVARVAFANPYWSARPAQYYRYAGLAKLALRDPAGGRARA